MEFRKIHLYKIITLLALMLAGFSYKVNADFIGVYAGVGTWNYTTSGQINNLGTDADFEDNFGLEDDFSGFAYIAVEHPFPLVPNIRLNHYALKTTSNTTLTAASAFTFAGTNYTAGTNIETELKWDESDSLLYYEFLDNIVSFDLGLGMKQINAELSVTTGGVSNILQIEESLPIAYAMLGAHIPGTGISIIVEQTQSFLGDIEIVQNNSKISYEMGYMFGFEAGYRTSTAKLDELPNITGEVEFSGPFANLLFHF